MLQPNSALRIPVRVQIGEKCFCQKKLRTTHQQWIAEAPFRLGDCASAEMRSCLQIKRPGQPQFLVLWA
jgi:hypothetical protein